MPKKKISEAILRRSIEPGIARIVRAIPLRDIGTEEDDIRLANEITAAVRRVFFKRGFWFGDIDWRQEG